MSRLEFYHQGFYGETVTTRLHHLSSSYIRDLLKFDVDGQKVMTKTTFTRHGQLRRQRMKAWDKLGFVPFDLEYDRHETERFIKRLWLELKRRGDN